MKKRVIIVLILILLCALLILLLSIWKSISPDDKNAEDTYAHHISPTPSFLATQAPEPTPKPTPESRVIYLTFDDGPYCYTERLLDILDEYDVKVTFFVTGKYGEYSELIKEEYERGHSIGAHSYSHDLNTVYENYPQDYLKINELIKEQTDRDAEIFRFPGGSSNTIAKEKMPGLIKEFSDRGLVYFDWDVDSCDATTAKTKNEVLSNMKAGAENSKVYSLILCHDVYDYTVDAVEDFIPWALENNFVFEALDTTSPVVHHR